MKKELLISLILVFVIGGAILWNMFPKPTPPDSVLSAVSQQTVIEPTVVKQSLTVDEVKKHATESDCWIIINSNVYNVTSYIPNHPGGPGQIIPLCGGDATSAFTTRGEKGPHPKQAQTMLNTLLVGEVQL